MSVFTLPAGVADIAFQNKALVYDLLFKAHRKMLSRSISAHAWASLLSCIHGARQ
jgi:hypothetical protein